MASYKPYTRSSVSDDATDSQSHSICKVCDKSVNSNHKGILCEICEFWFHAECQGVSNQIYKLLSDKSSSIHWFCTGCNGAAARLYKMVCALQANQDKLIEDVGQLSAEVANQNKSITDLSHEVKSIEAKISTSLCNKLDEKLKERDERQIRELNSIIFNLPESESDISDTRVNDDKRSFYKLSHEILDVNVTDNDISRIVRLGAKRDDGSARPLLVSFTSADVKRQVMRNAFHLKGNVNKIGINHDMSQEDRSLNKKLLQEARELNNGEDSGEFIYRVRGPPGSRKVVKLRVQSHSVLSNH